MSYNANSEIFVTSKMTKAGFISVLEKVGSPFAPQAEAIAELIDTWPVWGPEWARPIPLEFLLGICKHEHTYGTNVNSVLHRNDTNSWTNARSVVMPGLDYKIITDSERKSDYVKYATVEDSVRDALWRLQDPGYAYAKAGATTVHEIIALWAPSSDGNAPGKYTNDVVASMNKWVEMHPRKGANMKAATDRMISTLRQRGLEVHDLREELAGNANINYGVVDSVSYIILHWTGDRFTREFFKNVTGTDYHIDIISPNMSVDDEKDLAHWYDQYHAGKDGGSWPGIAYGVLIFPSGRIYVCFDIGKLSYHAYKANGVSYAVSCPNSQNQQPTTAQEAGLNHVIDFLVHHTPEITATNKDVYGHREATFLDERNKTSCPGTLSHVAPHWREHNEPTIPFEENPVADELVFPETGKKLVLGFKGRWELYEQVLGRERTVAVFGLPLTDELPDVDIDGEKRTVQVFERTVWAWHPENEGSFYEVQIIHAGRAWAEANGLL